MLALCPSFSLFAVPSHSRAPAAVRTSELVVLRRATIMRSMFPNTQWTELAHATLHGDQAGRAALESLCRNYWEPVRLFILQRGWAQDDAPDLAQSFFLFLMEKGMLHRA